MGPKTSRRHGPRSCFLLFWPGWYARSHYLWQCTIPTYGNYATPEAFYRVGADLTTFNLRLAFLTAFPLQFTVLHITERTVAQMEATS
jgi:hypothetical protein